MKLPVGHTSLGQIKNDKGGLTYIMSVGNPERLVDCAIHGAFKKLRKDLKLPVGLVLFTHRRAAGGWYGCEIDHDGVDTIYRVFHVENRQKTESVGKCITAAFAHAYAKTTGKTHKTRGATVSRDFGLCGSYLQDWFGVVHVD